MLSNIKTLALTGLLLLSGATAAPVEARDGLHHLKLNLQRFKDQWCTHRDGHGDMHVLQSGKCTSFEHKFSAYTLETWPQWDRRVEYFGDFGTCEVIFFQKPDCEDRIVGVQGINLPGSQAIKHCGNLNAKAHSAKIVCKRDGVQVDEVPMHDV